MADMEKRLKFYNGQFLQQQDFTDEQQYHLDRLRRHNRQMHTYGIAEGLAVTAAVGGSSASVAPGTALDAEGRTIVLPQSRNLTFGSLANQWVLVVISYAEQPSDPASVGDEGDTRWWERPNVEVIPETGAPAADVRIRLARLQLAANGTISQHDTAVRTSAGVKLGTEVSIERIRLSRQGVSSNLWPVLSSGAAQQADLAGNFNVTGNIAVTGTVDGRDVSVDGANNDTHRNRTDNPHATTAAQVGAITGVGGVLNPGGQVNLLAGNNIAITPDNGTNKRITIASATIDGVSNPGGNIDFVGQGALTITPDNTNKLIAFNVDLLAAGAFTKRAIPTAIFSQSDGDGATRTVNLGFQPKLIWAQGSIQSALAGYTHGGPVKGMCFCYDNLTHYAVGTGPTLYRYTTAPYIITNYSTHYASGVVARSSFYDYTLNPATHTDVFVYIDSLSATGFTVRLGRTTSGGFNAPVNAYVTMSFIVLG